MTDDDARRRLANAVLDAAGALDVRVAILGGTGSFGRALAARLVAVGEDEVVIGSRDAERAARGGGRARRRRATGATNDDAVRGADLAVLAVKADAALDTARAIAGRARRRRRSSRSRARSRSAPDGVRPDPDARSLAERVQDVVGAPGRRRASTRSPPRTSPRRRPTRTRSSAATTPRAKELALELAAKVVAGRALDAGPLASARTLEGLTAVIVNLNRRYKGHAGIRVTGLAVIAILPVEGLPEIERGRRPRRADRRPRASSRTATSSSSRRRRSRRPRAASSGSRTSRRPTRARELAGDARPARGRGRSSARRRGSSARGRRS